MPFIVVLLACGYSFLKFSQVPLMLQGCHWWFMWALIARGGSGKWEQPQGVSPREPESRGRHCALLSAVRCTGDLVLQLLVGLGCLFRR